jgi:hypothetical protein
VPTPGQGDNSWQEIQSQTEYKSGNAEYTTEEKSEWVQRRTSKQSNGIQFTEQRFLLQAGLSEIQKMLWTDRRLAAIISGNSMIYGRR